VTSEGIRAIHDYLAKRFPALKDAPIVETRVCQYENTSNGDFLIDRHPQLQNVFLVGGGSGHGFKHGPAVGEVHRRAGERYGYAGAALLSDDKGEGSAKDSLLRPECALLALRLGLVRSHALPWHASSEQSSGNAVKGVDWQVHADYDRAQARDSPALGSSTRVWDSSLVSIWRRSAVPRIITVRAMRANALPATTKQKIQK
jgi:hypothetical protein